MAHRTLTRWLPLVTAVLALTVLVGCSSGPRHDPLCGCAPTCVPSGCGGLPTDLPRDPDPCLKYCKVWVPPVYRDVPSLESTPGCVHTVQKDVTITCFEDREVRPRTCKSLTHQPCPCQQTAVEVCPGGYKWQEVGCDCWKYCYQAPTYKWCTKEVKEDKICYCAETPPEYETVVTRRPSKVCDVKYVPPKYEVVWKKECYRPGHYEWRPVPDACGTCQPVPCEPRTYFVPTPKAGVTATCPRCN
jgi:hypothetical protein